MLSYARECFENVFSNSSGFQSESSQLVIQIYINHNKSPSFDKRHWTNGRLQEGHLFTSESVVELNDILLKADRLIVLQRYYIPN